MKYKIQIQTLLAGMYLKYKYKYFEKYLNAFQILLCTIPEHPYYLLLHVMNLLLQIIDCT